MRLTSDFWAAAFIRSVFAGGGFAYLARRGAEEAGALFLQQTLEPQTLAPETLGPPALPPAEAEAGRAQYALYGPAPQSFYLGEAEGAAAAGGDRLFIELLRGSGAEIAARLEREENFDPDIWLIEVENFPDLRHAANLRLVAPPAAAAGRNICGR